MNHQTPNTQLGVRSGFSATLFSERLERTRQLNSTQQKEYIPKAAFSKLLLCSHSKRKHKLNIYSQFNTLHSHETYGQEQGL